MKTNWLAFLVFFLVTTCSGQRIFSSKKGDFFIDSTGNRMVSVKYSNIDEINSESKIKFVIGNSKTEPMFVFSTIMENSNMLYSGKNLSPTNEGLIIDSFYKDFRKDLIYAGQEAYSFIEVKSGESLVVYLDESKTPKANNYKLRYYCFFNNEKNVLIDIDKTDIIEKEVEQQL